MAGGGHFPLVIFTSDSNASPLRTRGHFGLYLGVSISVSYNASDEVRRPDTIVLHVLQSKMLFAAIEVEFECTTYAT